MKKMAVLRFIVSTISMIVLVTLIISVTKLDSAFAQTPARDPFEHIHQCDPLCLSVLSQAAAPEGKFLIVSNTGEETNGDVSSPAALIASPGPDGISLSEAITAAEATVEFDIIQFDSSLKGSVINPLAGLPSIRNGNLMIDGDIDDDALPDITIDGSNSARDRAFILEGASHVMIKGFIVQNFNKHAISISPDTSVGKAIVEDIVLYQNTLSSAMNAIEVGMWQQNHTAIHNVEIIANTLHDSDGGIAVHAGMGDGATDNEISGVSIISNTINNPGYHIAVFLSPSSTAGLSRNTITDVEIRGNLITGHTNSSILIDASNQAGCIDNAVDGVVIAENRIDGPHVTIEVIAESGMDSTGNTVSNVTITGNELTGGGIQFGSATGYNAHDNTISTVLIERNQISSCQANGIYLIAGSGGAHHNRLENVTLRSNFINNCTDTGILLHGDTSYSPNNTINNVTITNQTLVNNGNSWAGGLNINSKDASNIITGVTFTNSILWGNDGGDAIRGALVPAVVAYNLLGDARFVGTNNNFYQDPQFEDTTSGNYHLQPTSICVDAGDPSALSVGAKDLDSNIRVWNGNNDTSAIVDLGAWEYDAPAMQEINIRGNGISINNGDIVPTTWDATDFGAVQVGTPLTQTFTLENIGTAPLNLTGNPQVVMTGTNAGDFSIRSQPGSQIPGGEFGAFTIEFTPQAAGLRVATISIANDDNDENPYTFTIQGTGTLYAVEPEMNVRGNGVSIPTGAVSPSLSDATDFGDTALTGEPVQHSFTIENTGAAALALSGDPMIEITGAHAGDFTVIAQPGSQIAAGETVTFTIGFTPSEEGLREATVSIVNNDGDENPYTFAIKGTGTAQISRVFFPLVLLRHP